MKYLLILVTILSAATLSAAEPQMKTETLTVPSASTRTSVAAMVRNVNIVETTFKEGLCEVEMEIVISHAQFK